MKLKLFLTTLILSSFLNVRSQTYLAGNTITCSYDFIPDATVSYTPIGGSGYNIQTYSLSVFGGVNDLEIRASTGGGLGGGSGSIFFKPLNPYLSIKFDRKDSVYNMACNCYLSARIAKKHFLNDTLNTSYAKWDSLGLSLTAFSWQGGGPNLTVTDWVGGSDKYVGLRYKNGSVTEYAWIRVYLPTANKVEIKEYSSSTNFAAPLPVNMTPLANQTICGGKNATLTVSGNTVSWFASATSTTVIGSGTVFVSAPLPNAASQTTHTFYAEESTGCIPGGRTAITLTVLPAPSLSAYSNSTTICPGDTCVIYASGALSYTWASSQPNYTTCTCSGPSAIYAWPSSTATYTITGLNTWTNSCTSDIVFTQTVVSCVGVDELQKEKFTIYPNPFNSEIYLENSGFELIQLFDCLSREIKINTENSGDKTKLIVDPELSKGIYYLKISGKNGSFTKKLVKS